MWLFFGGKKSQKGLKESEEQGKMFPPLPTALQKRRNRSQIEFFFYSEGKVSWTLFFCIPLLEYKPTIHKKKIQQLVQSE